MVPRDTVYKLATQPSDYAQCHALMKRYQLASDRLGWPTVLAFRDGKLLGFLSTHRKRDALLAGPLVVDKKASIFTVLRLLEGYEEVLTAAGAKHYWFTAETEGMRSAVKKLISKYGGVTEVTSRDDGSVLYRRNLVE